MINLPLNYDSLPTLYQEIYNMEIALNCRKQFFKSVYHISYEEYKYYLENYSNSEITEIRNTGEMQ